MEIRIPEMSIVLLIGPEGAGKTAFAHRHFSPTEILSLHTFHGMVNDHRPGERASAHAALDFVLEQRLQNRALTVIDAPSLTATDRKTYRALARKYYARITAIIFEFSEAESNAWAGPEWPTRHINAQLNRMEVKPAHLQSERIKDSFHFRKLAELEQVELVREPMPGDFRGERGPFDVVGDVHGCRAELEELLAKLGYQQSGEMGARRLRHPQGRRLVLVGDLVDRGPDSVGVLKLVMDWVRAGDAFWVPGNHDDKLRRFLAGRNVKVAHGLETTVAELESEDAAFKTELEAFIKDLPPYLELDGGKLAVTHAGLKANMIGRFNGEIFSFCLYGETTGEIDDFGMPVRHNWAGEYDGEALVVYGHTPIPEPLWQGNTLNVDTGCVFGGQLTALRYPERNLVSIPAQKVYAEPKRPLLSNIPDLSAQSEGASLLDYQRLSGRNLVSTRLKYHVTLQQEAAGPTHQALGRRGVNPGWMVFLPVDYSPPKLAASTQFPEHPQQAFNYYRKKGVGKLLVHSGGRGKRVIVVLCRSEGVARKKFGVVREGLGCIYTGKGQPLFSDPQREQAELKRLRDALEAKDWWSQEQSNWVVLEGEIHGAVEEVWGKEYDELMAVAEAGKASAESSLNALEEFEEAGVEIPGLLQRMRVRRQRVERFQEAVASLDGPLHIALWHLLAKEGQLGVEQDQVWHLSQLGSLCHGIEGLSVPAHVLVDLDSESSQREGNAWFEAHVRQGGLGAVVKPLAFYMEGSADIIQPGLKIRGPAGLRLVYGPEFEAELESMQGRQLKDKRLRVLRQFALALEAIYRFSEAEPLLERYSCIFTAISLDTVEVDPRH